MCGNGAVQGWTYAVETKITVVTSASGRTSVGKTGILNRLFYQTVIL
jgi:hypothetical protein